MVRKFILKVIQFQNELLTISNELNTIHVTIETNSMGL